METQAKQHYTLTETQLRGLLINTMEAFESEFGTDLPVSTLILLLKLPTTGSVPMSQLVKQSKLSPGGVTRTVSTLGGLRAANRRTVEKPYLTVADDPNDRRYKLISLTDYGREFVKGVTSLVDRYAGA